jgi:hypothetical protein
MLRLSERLQNRSAGWRGRMPEAFRKIPLLQESQDHD